MSDSPLRLKRVRLHAQADCDWSLATSYVIRPQNRRVRSWSGFETASHPTAGQVEFSSVSNVLCCSIDNVFVPEFGRQYVSDENLAGSDEVQTDDSGVQSPMGSTTTTRSPSLIDLRDQLSHQDSMFEDPVPLHPRPLGTVWVDAESPIYSPEHIPTRSPAQTAVESIHDVETGSGDIGFLMPHRPASFDLTKF